jgi:hypothetical protein
VLAATWWAVRARSSRAAQDVRAVGLLGVFVVAFGDPLIQVGGVGVAAVRAGLDSAQRCGRHPRNTITQLAVCLLRRADRYRLREFGYTSRTALLTKRRAVRSTNTWLPSVHDAR